MRLWIDTDVGTNLDDAVALLCAAGHRDVELVGVSTVDGDTEWRAEIARTLVDVPVVPGARLRGPTSPCRRPRHCSPSGRSRTSPVWPPPAPSRPAWV